MAKGFDETFAELKSTNEHNLTDMQLEGLAQLIIRGQNAAKYIQACKENNQRG